MAEPSASATIDALALWYCDRQRKAEARAQARSTRDEPTTTSGAAATSGSVSASASASGHSGTHASLMQPPAVVRARSLEPIGAPLSSSSSIATASPLGIDTTPARRNRPNLAPILTGAATTAAVATTAAATAVPAAAPAQEQAQAASPAASVHDGTPMTPMQHRTDSERLAKAGDAAPGPCCCGQHTGAGAVAVAHTVAAAESRIAWTTQRRDTFWPFVDRDRTPTALAPLLPTATAAPPQAQAQADPRLTWTLALAGRFNVKLAALRELAPTPNSTWKAEEIRAAHARQQMEPQDDVLHVADAHPAQGERAPYRSDLLRAVDGIFALFRRFHAQHSATPSSASMDPSAHLLAHAVYLRCTSDALTSLAHALIHIYEGVFHRLWHSGGRDLFPHLFLHNELSLLIRSFRDTLQFLDERHRALQATAEAKTQPAGAVAAAVASSSSTLVASSMQPLSDLIVVLQSLSSRLLECARHAAEQWCDSTWPELFGFDEGGPTSGALASGRTRSAGNEGADAWLVRREMPRPLPVMHDYIATATVAAAVAATAAPTLGSDAGANAATATLSPSHVRSPSAPATSSSSFSSAVTQSERPTPLLLVLEEYFLPLVASAGQVCESVSGGLVLSRVLDAILHSFLSFLLRTRLRINAQGAARLNVEARWAWRWVHFAHVRPLRPSSSPSDAPFAPLPLPQPCGLFPRASSAFLHSAGLHDVLSEKTLRWWRRCCVEQCAGVWARMAAVALVMMQPRSYATATAFSAAGAIGGGSSGGSKGSKRAIGHSNSAVQTWSWGAVASPSPSPSPSPNPATATAGAAAAAAAAPPPSEPPRHTSNRVAPMPPALALVSPPGHNPASPSSSSPGYASLTDARGFSLPDLSRWLSMASYAHHKEFQPVGYDNAATVDWPAAERR